MITVKVKGTTLRFPDSFSKEQIDAIVKRDFFSGNAAPAAKPEAEAEAFRANQKRIRDEKIAAGGVAGDRANLTETPFERAAVGLANAGGRVADFLGKHVGGSGEDPATARALNMAEARFRQPVRPTDAESQIATRAGVAAIPEVMSGVGKEVMGNAVLPIMAAAGGTDPETERAMQMAGALFDAPVRPSQDEQKAAIARGLEYLEPTSDAEKFGYYTALGVELASIPKAIYNVYKAYSVAKGLGKAADSLLAQFAEKGIQLTEDQVRAVRAGEKIKLTAAQMASVGKAEMASKPVSKVVPEAPVGAPAAPAPSAPAAPAPAPLSKKAQALQAKIAMIEQKIAEAEANGLAKGAVARLKGQRTKHTKALNGEIRASAKFAKKQAKAEQRPIPALAGSADAETAPEILFSEQVPRAPGLFRTEAQKIAIARGEAEIISDADIARAAAQGSKPALRDKAGEVIRGLEAPAPTAMGETGPVGKVAQNLLADTNSVHAMRVQAVDDWLNRALKGWTQEQYDTVIDTLEGKVTAEQMAKTTPEVRAVTETLRRIFSDADREATILKLRKELRSGEVVDYYGRRNFFPHLDTIDIGEVEKIMAKGHVPLRPDQKSRLLKGGDVDDVLEPAQAAILRKSPVPPQRVKAGTKSGSITYERDADGAFNRDLKDVVRRYVDRAYRQFEEVKHFGPEPHKGITQIEELARANGENGDFVRDTLQLALGGGVRAADSHLTGVIGDLISFEALAKLPFASIGQVNQVVNPMVKAGFGNTATAALRLANDLVGTGDGEVLAAARRAAPIFGDIMHGIAGERPGSWVSRFGKMQLKVSGFRAEDEALRYLSAATGVLHAEDTLKAARGVPPSWLARVTGDLRKTTTVRDQALRDLMDARVDVENALKTGRLTEMDKARYAHWFARKTQFGMRVEDAPLYFAKGPVGKLIWLFKKWGVNQMDLARREVLGPVAKGDIRPLMRFLVATPIVGEGANQVMDAMLNRDRSESGIPKRAFDAYMAGSFGFLGQVINSATSVTEVGDLFPTARTATELGKLAGKNAKDIGAAALESAQTGDLDPFATMLQDWGDENTLNGEGRYWDAAAGISRHAKAVRNWIRDDGEEPVVFKKFRDHKF